MFNTLALLIVDHVDGVLLAGLVLADGGGLECADGRDGGRGAEAHASASCGLERGAGEERYAQLFVAVLATVQMAVIGEADLRDELGEPGVRVCFCESRMIAIGGGPLAAVVAC